MGKNYTDYLAESEENNRRIMAKYGMPPINRYDGDTSLLQQGEVKIVKPASRPVPQEEIVEHEKRHRLGLAGIKYTAPAEPEQLSMF